MNYTLLFQRLSELCAEMISAGGSSDTIPNRMKYLCKKYGFTESIFIVEPNGMMSHAIDPEGNPVSCICEITLGESNFGKLNALDKYLYQVFRELPSEIEISAKLEEINNRNYLPKATEYLAAVLGGTGFAIMFGCNIYDTMTAVFACLLVVFLGDFVKKLNTNLFIYNSVMCIVIETLILASAKYVGICQHPDRITLGVIMLLISGLGVTDGLNSLMYSRTTLGIAKINSSLVGALGIALGIALPLIIIGTEDFEGFVLNENFVVQTLSCTIACVGFGLWFCVDKKLLPYIAICACICWLVYSLVYSIYPNLFVATTIATLVEAIASVLISIRIGIIPSIILTVSIFPMIPGPNLFYMLYGFVTKNNALIAEQFIELLVTCLGITLGLSLLAFVFSQDQINRDRIKHM